MVDSVLVAMLDGVDYLQENVFYGVRIPSERARVVDGAMEVQAIAVVKDEKTKVFVFGDGVQGNDVGVFCEDAMVDGLQAQ